MANRPTIVESLPEDQKIWFISDLHLGDGTPSDAFFGKDRHLMALVRTVDREGGILVINGDAMDFHQAWTFSRILRAHQELLSAMSRLARKGRLYYVIGNHDYDLGLYREILNFRVCEQLEIGDRILVRHGYEYDPYLSVHLHKGHTATKVHHLIERYLDTWLRIPLGEFYTKTNRFAFWLAHKAALVVWTYAESLRRGGVLKGLTRPEQRINYWATGNMGDSMCMFRPAWTHLHESHWQYIVCGHSHVPGIVRDGDMAYVNSGSWTFSSSWYLVWDGEDFICRDWITGRQVDDEFYARLLDGTIYQKDFWDWWRENYMGMFRFREGEEKHGRLRGWEAYVRDYQDLARLGSADINPLEPLVTAEQERPAEPPALIADTLPTPDLSPVPEEDEQAEAEVRRRA